MLLRSRKIRGRLLNTAWAKMATRCFRPAAAVWPGRMATIAGPGSTFPCRRSSRRCRSTWAGRVVDATRLKGKYDIDMKWGVDVAWLLEMAGRRDQIAELPDTGPTGPTLIRAVQDQLGLKLNSKKGLGDFVVVDHVEKVPTEN